MQFHIVPGDELPIYRQIMRQITDAVAGGRLRLGDKLPSQRELAEKLVISPLTVKKAYDELEREGIIRTQRGRGTFIGTTTSAIDPEKQRRRLRTAVRQLLSQAHLSGVPFAEVESLLEEVDAELRAERAQSQSTRKQSE
ncbi:MAG: GntR family transcriptional regulator [bacterium]|nr:GntR family transcriptional regulator [bacterium]